MLSPLCLFCKPAFFLRKVLASSVKVAYYTDMPQHNVSGLFGRVAMNMDKYVADYRRNDEVDFDEADIIERAVELTSADEVLDAFAGPFLPLLSTAALKYVSTGDKEGLLCYVQAAIETYAMKVYGETARQKMFDDVVYESEFYRA